MNIPGQRFGRLSFTLLIAPLIALLGMATGEAVLAADFQTLFREAAQARGAGDFTTTRRKLERALALKPDHADALFQLALVVAFQKEYARALRLLQRARALAPDNLDMRIAAARIKGWQGAVEAALAEARALAAEAPANVEIHNLLGRLYYYIKAHDAALRAFQTAAELDPANQAAKKGLRDVARAKSAAAERKPGDAPFADQAEFRWRLDVGFEGSEFSRSANKGWNEGYGQLTHAFSSRTSVHFRSQLSRRFGLEDQFYRIGVDHRFAKDMRGHLRLGVTPTADFLPRWSLDAGGSLGLMEKSNLIGPLFGTLDLGNRHYATGDMGKLDPGGQLYLFDGLAWLTGRWINIMDIRAGKRLSGWSGRADWQMVHDLRVFAGMSIAPETDRGATVDTRSRFTGLVVEFTPRFAANVAYTRDNRERSYIRNVFSIGMTFKF